MSEGQIKRYFIGYPTEGSACAVHEELQLSIYVFAYKDVLIEVHFFMFPLIGLLDIYTYLIFLHSIRDEIFCSSCLTAVYRMAECCKTSPAPAACSCTHFLCNIFLFSATQHHSSQNMGSTPPTGSNLNSQC